MWLYHEVVHHILGDADVQLVVVLLTELLCALQRQPQYDVEIKSQDEQNNLQGRHWYSVTGVVPLGNGNPNLQFLKVDQHFQVSYIYPSLDGALFTGSAYLNV